jgi:hypothetical protein
MNNPLIVTDHARKAMMLRRVSIDEVLKIISDPEVTDKSSLGITRYFRGRLCVVTRKDDRNAIVVKTVLYRYGQTWTDEDVRNRTP